MKILTVTYFYDFSRYFSYLEQKIKSSFIDNQVEFFNISMYPCAHNYRVKNNEHSLFIGNITYSSDKYTYDKYKDDIDNLVSFNMKALQLYGIENKKSLIKRAIIYLNYFDDIFEKEQFTHFISSGDSRLLPSILIYLAKKYNVKIIFFEQGPFNSTMLDRNGVNANISFDFEYKELNIEEKKKLYDFIDNFKKNKVDKFWKAEKYVSKFSRLRTYLYLYPPSFIRLIMPSDLMIGLSCSQIIKSNLPFLSNKMKHNLDYKEVNNDFIYNHQYISLFLQVPVDAQLIEHSPNYSEFYTMVKDIVENKPKNMLLIIREHPQYAGKYDQRIYDLIKNRSDTYIGNKVTLSELILNSECCIVNNSAVGIESLLMKKNVVCLGNSYYSNKGITFDLEQDTDLKGLLNKAIDTPFDERKVDSFLYQFIFEYLEHGHYQDLELNMPLSLERFLLND